jgi:hypothetical protein
MGEIKKKTKKIGREGEAEGRKEEGNKENNSKKIRGK